MRIVIVGAGVAGLTAARTLHRAGADVTVYEASDAVGGRVRSDVVRGFTLDRGFQVLFTAYPAAARELDYKALSLRIFEPGAVVSFAASRQTLSDPFRDPGALFPALAANIVTLEDKLRTALLAAECKARSTENIMRGKDETTEAFLLRHGFSGAYIERFIRPFFGSIFLDRGLQTSARAFAYDWKMLASGDTVVPAGGMRTIAAQLAVHLFAAGAVRLNTPVAALIKGDKGDRVTGIRLESGETMTADAVVVATPAPEAARLTGATLPIAHVGTTCVYFSGTASVYDGKKIILHANPGAFVSNMTQMDNIAPEYAPPGAHLVSATILGVPEMGDGDIYAAALGDMRRIWAGDKRALSATDCLKPLALYRIPQAQFAQPVGIYETLPDSTTNTPGLYFAAEWTAASSTNAAMESGAAAARAILG